MKKYNKTKSNVNENIVDDQTRMIQNDVKLGIGWEDNAALSKFKKTSGLTVKKRLYHVHQSSL